MARKRGARLGALTALIALSAPLEAAAGFIGITDARQIYATCTAGFQDSCHGVFDARADPSAPFAFFDESVTAGRFVASQTSRFSSGVLDGSGSILGGDGGGSVGSIYSIAFDVDLATPFSLSGALLCNPNLFSVGSKSLSLSDLTRGTRVFEAGPSPSGASTPFDTSGVLAPGSYQIVASFTAGSPTSEIYGDYRSFQFQLLAIPEPGTALLLGAGLAMLACRRQRQLST